MMRFKEFLQIEDASSQEQGAFIHVNAKDTGHRVPSDGQPFSQYLNHTSGAKPSQGGGGGGGGGMDSGMGGGAMFMKKLMAKKMKKKMNKK
jgi:hypothetical protein